MRLLVPVLLLACLAGAGSAAAAAPCGTHPWCDRALSADSRARLLLSRMTLEEKAGLMGARQTRAINSRIPGIPRLGVPDVYLTDGPAGVRTGHGLGRDARYSAPSTGMPAPIALAAGFDPGVARRYGSVVGAEALSLGQDVLLGPTINIARTPLNGRTFEGFGEDPLLAARTAVGFIRGVQSREVAADAKHFAANNQEDGRATLDAVVEERALHEIYLPAFKAAVEEAHVATVMAAYNRVNGTFASENAALLDGILKRDWRFDGIALSDYGATHSTVAAANAGLDLELPEAAFFTTTALIEAVNADTISSATIDEHALRILRVMFRFGMFDRSRSRANRPAGLRAHADEAARVEENGIVMLKNRRRALPIPARGTRPIAVIGRLAARYHQGIGSATVGRPYRPVTPLAGIRARARGRVLYSPGRSLRQARAVARRARVAVVFAGDRESEFEDRGCLTLGCSAAAPRQNALVRAVATANPRTVVVLETGGPVLMPWLAHVPAVLEAWYPGERGGTAIASVLFGRRDPGGRLPITFPRRASDIPAATPEQYPGVNGRTLYSEGVFVGYRHYDAAGITPLFPFGHGLSFARVAIGRPVVTATGSGRLRVRVRARNTSSHRGSAVVQLYVGAPTPAAPVPVAARQLRGFRKLHLAAGERRQVTFTLRPRDFAHWDTATHAWSAPAGCYPVQIGLSSRTVQSAARPACF